MGAKIDPKSIQKLWTWRSETALKKWCKKVWKLMPLDNAGRGWDSSENLSQHISSLFEKGAKRDQTWVQNGAKIVKKWCPKGYSKHNTKNMRKISQKVSPRDAKWRPKSIKNPPQDHLQNTFGQIWGPRSAQGTKKVPKWGPGHPKIVIFWSIFNGKRWEQPEENHKNTTGKAERNDSKTQGKTQANNRTIARKP